ncbi:MAG: hypothetical protein ONB55_21715 [candidate division KSB1 bacterium]|nr:hypothetical protein [candidate division KSB1 bacterium]
MRNLVTLEQVKAWMNAENTTENDGFYRHLQNGVSQLIEKYCARPFVTQHYMVYYDTNGDNTLILNHFPIYRNGVSFSLWIDYERVFGNSTLIDSSEYHLSEESGMILLYERTFPVGKRMVKTDYWAGLSRFEVEENVNDRLDLGDYDLSSIQIPAGSYIAETLAAKIQELANPTGSFANPLSVQYRHDTQRFTISRSAPFSLLLKTGDNTSKSIGKLLGYSTVEDKTGLTAYEADFAVTGLSGDIPIAAEMIIHSWFSNSARGGETLPVSSREAGGDITVNFDKQSIPREAKTILDHYVQWN